MKILNNYVIVVIIAVAVLAISWFSIGYTMKAGSLCCIKAHACCCGDACAKSGKCCCKDLNCKEACLKSCDKSCKEGCCKK